MLIRYVTFAGVCTLLIALTAGCWKRSKTKTLKLGIIGIEEPVYIEPFAKPFEAKIDTGADIASIDAEEIREIRKNGETFIAFRIRQRETGESHEYEMPLIRIIPITRHGMKPQKRFVVLMKIRLGSLFLKKEFSLANRSNFSCQVLIGRNILAGNAAVDVRKKNTLQ